MRWRKETGGSSEQRGPTGNRGCLTCQSIEAEVLRVECKHLGSLEAVSPRRWQSIRREISMSMGDKEAQTGGLQTKIERGLHKGQRGQESS